MFHPPSTTDSSFRVEVSRCLECDSEAVVWVRFANRAGASQLYLCRNNADFEEILHKTPSKACVSVCFEPALPIRGRIDAELLRRAYDLLEVHKSRPEDSDGDTEGIDVIRLDGKDLILGTDDYQWFRTREELTHWFERYTARNLNRRIWRRQNS